MAKRTTRLGAMMGTYFRLGVIGAMVVTASVATAGDPGVIWVEAERFGNTGGWVADWQFMDTMGSPYLLAASIGRPVADATTTVPVLADGTFRLWVRCRDWLPEHSPGKFAVSVNGRRSSTVFGAAPTDAWQWVDGGEFALEKGEVSLCLHDLTGWWARCDAIVLSRSVVPSNDAAEMQRQRVAYGGVSAEVKQRGSYDVVVVGGGLAGCSAAVAAARHGCSVAFIQDRPTLGGNASNEIHVAISGDTSKEPLDPRETGIIEELAPPTGGAGRSPQFERVVRGEKNIDLMLGTRATSVTMADKNTIRSVLACDPLSGQRLEVHGKYVIDCTGDGWIGHWAGADYRTGREGTKEFNEPGAPPEHDPYSLSTSLNRAGLETHDAPVPFKAPEWAYSWPSCADFDQSPKKTVHSRGDLPPDGWYNMARGKGRHPEHIHDVGRAWWLEFGGMLNTVKDAEHIRDEILRIKIGLWDHMKNHCPKLKAEAARCELVSVTHIAGKRESRRLLGDYVFSQRDYMDRSAPKDTVFYGGYNVDPHHPQGFWTVGPQAFRLYHYKVNVPYRILYSRNIGNLFMAGRNISATHLGMNGIRVMRTTCMMGQVVGTAAALAKAHDTSPRGVGQEHIRELQQALLRDGCYLPGIPNADPADLARHAEVTSSSVRTSRPGAQTVALSPENVIDGWNRAVSGRPNSWAPDTTKPGPHWLELGFPEPVRIGAVHVSFQQFGMHAAAYDLLVPDGGGWRAIAEVRGNVQRRRVDSFPAVKTDRLRLQLRGTDAEIDQARICEVRIYAP